MVRILAVVWENKGLIIFQEVVIRFEFGINQLVNGPSGQLLYKLYKLFTKQVFEEVLDILKLFDIYILINQISLLPMLIWDELVSEVSLMECID